MLKSRQGAEIPDALLARSPISMTAHKRRYARVYGQKVEYFERPAPTGRGESYREPKRVHSPLGFKGRYRTKAEALAAAEKWEASA